MAARSPWYAHGVTALMSAIAAGVSGYYASGAGSSADKIAASEHRLTQIEDSILAHAQADALQRTDWNQQAHNLWWAIAKNHGDPAPVVAQP